MKANRSKGAKLRLCFIAQRFPILGRTSDTGFLWPIARGLADLGHEVTVISSRSPIHRQTVFRDGVQVYYLFEESHKFKGFSFEDAVLAQFTEIQNERKIQLIHSLDRSGLSLSKKKKEFGIKVAYDAEATEMAQLFSISGMAQETVGSILATGFAFLYKYLTTYFTKDRELLKTADGVFVTSPAQRLFLERYYMYPDARIFSVPYGVDMTDSPEINSEGGELVKKKFDLKANSQIVLSITDMTDINDCISLLHAFERVAIKKPFAKLVILGTGPARFKIEHEILMRALSSRVILPGAVNPQEISDWISISQVLVNLSARTSGFEASIIEAMVQGKVFIGSELSPVAHLIQDGHDGFLIRPADFLSLSHLLIEIFSGTFSIDEVGERARHKVTNLFDPKKMVQSVETAYYNLLDYD